MGKLTQLLDGVLDIAGQLIQHLGIFAALTETEGVVVSSRRGLLRRCPMSWATCSEPAPSCGPWRPT